MNIKNCLNSIEIMYIICTDCLDWPKKLNIQNYVYSMVNYLHYVYGLSRFAKKLKIENCVNSTGNWVYYMYGMYGFADKLNIQIWINSTENSVHYVHYLYGQSGFAKKSIIQNAVNSLGIVYIISTQCLDLQKKLIFPELRKFNGKLCTLYVRNIWRC